MSSDHKKSTMEAIERFYKRQEPKDVKPKRTNAKPEKIVETMCMEWFKLNGWNMQVFESKAKFINGRWQSAGLKYGNADCQGNTPEGFAAYVEFKAKGKLKTFWAPKNQRQIDFIINKISSNAFACVVDDPLQINNIYKKWLSAKKHPGTSLDCEKILLDALPQKPATRSDEKNGLGF